MNQTPRIFALHIGQTSKSNDFQNDTNPDLRNALSGSLKSSQSKLGLLLTKYCIGLGCNIQPEKIKIQKSPGGKPFWKNDGQFFFNIAHANRWVICGTGNAEIGVDIEFIKRKSVASISSAFFSSQEQDYINSESDKLRAFYKIWTLKESYLKCIGKGLNYPLKEFCVINRKYTKGYDPSQKQDKFKFKSFELGSEYLIGICTKGKQLPKAIETISLSELINTKDIEHDNYCS